MKELEVELLTASQKLAAGAGVHAHQMSEQAAQLDRCKVRGVSVKFLHGKFHGLLGKNIYSLTIIFHEIIFFEQVHKGRLLMS